MNIRKFVLTGLAFLLFMSGCVQEKEWYGAAITEAQAVSIGDVLENTDAYLGKTVRVEGRIATECPSGCWFHVSDGTGEIYVDLLKAQLAIPQRVGHRVVLQGDVQRRAGVTMINAKGIQIK